MSDFSQNETLQELSLFRNQIGDAGAASIGDALAYVQLKYATESFHFLFYAFSIQFGHASASYKVDFWIDN